MMKKKGGTSIERWRRTNRGEERSAYAKNKHVSVDKIYEKEKRRKQ